MPRLARWLGCLPGPVLWTTLAAAQGSLAPTTWSEQLSLSTADSSWEESGVDPFAPEDLLNGVPDPGGAGAAGYVIFHNAPYPVECATVPEYGPRGTVGASASVVPGRPADALAELTVEFQCQVVQVSEPPVAVSGVPVRATVCGTVEASGGHPAVVATAYSSIAISYSEQGFPTSYLVDAAVNADNNPGSLVPGSDAYAFEAMDFFPTDAVLDGRLVAQVVCSSEQNPTDSGGTTATAFADPWIEVADQTIPGSSDSYRDHFRIAFGSGYGLLDPIPVQPTTWGRLKARYRD